MLPISEAIKLKNILTLLRYKIFKCCGFIQLMYELYDTLR